MLTIRQPSAADMMSMYRSCGEENDRMIMFYAAAVTVVAINGKPTVRTSKKELDYILQSFGSMTNMAEAMGVISNALNELTGNDVLPKPGETPEQFAQRTAALKTFAGAAIGAERR